MTRPSTKDEGWDLDPVVVRWLDAKVPAPGWEDIATMGPLEPLHCTTIGFLLSEDDTAIVLAQTVGEMEVQGRIVIPRGCIVTMLRAKKWQKKKEKRKK